MSEGDGWVNPEVLDNPTGEPPEVPDPEAVLAAEDAEGEATEATPVEGEAVEPEAEDGPSKAESGLLNELRETRKERNEERLANAERNRVLEERLSKMQEAWEASRAPAGPQAPDPEEDPLGSINYKQEQIAAQLQQQNEQSQLQQEQLQQQQQMQQVAQQIQTQEKSFMESSGVENQDYESALDYARAEVQSFVESMGYTPEQAAQEAQLEQIRFAAQCMQNGVNPAEARYNMAVARGYKPPSAEPAAPAGDGEAPADPAAVAKMLDFKKGAVESSKSLSPAGGSPGKRRITLEELGEMPNDVFDKITKDPNLFEKISVEGSILI